MPDALLVSLLPESLMPPAAKDGSASFSAMLSVRQATLGRALTERLLGRPRRVGAEELAGELSQDGRLDLFAGSGVPDFIVLSRYDTSQCHELRSVARAETSVEQGLLITTSPERIAEKLPELVALHEAVFDDQAAQTGYYGGLEPDAIIEAAGSGEFVSVAVFDQATGDALCFAMLAPNLIHIEELEFANPSSVRDAVAAASTTPNHVVAIPYVITSRGVGLFPKVVEVGAREALFRTKADELFTLYNSTAASIHYTPAILNRTLERLGFVHAESTMQAMFLVQPQASLRE